MQEWTLTDDCSYTVQTNIHKCVISSESMQNYVVHVYNYKSVADPGFMKGGAVHPSRGVWGYAPPENFGLLSMTIHARELCARTGARDMHTNVD